MCVGIYTNDVREQTIVMSELLTLMMYILSVPFLTNYFGMFNIFTKNFREANTYRTQIPPWIEVLLGECAYTIYQSFTRLVRQSS